MKPQDIVPTLETCQALKEAGFIQEDSAHYWVFTNTLAPGVSRAVTPVLLPFEVMERWPQAYRQFKHIAAPTLQEILSTLPYIHRSVNGVLGPWLVGSSLTARPQHHCPTEAAALLWLSLQEEKVPTP